MKRSGFVVLVMGLVLLFAFSSEAKTTRETTYRYNQLWRTAIRFLRVDNGFSVVEKDPKAGYVLFDYRESGRTYRASLELVPTVRAGKKYVTTGLRIEDMPSYVEVVLVDKLMRKLRSEYGEPPPAASVTSSSEGAASSESDNSDSTTGDGPPEDEKDIEVDDENLENTEKE